MMRSRKSFHRFFGFWVFFVLFLGCVVAGGGSAGAEKVTFALDWIPFGKHVPFYVSLDKGFFKEAGLDVNIVRGNGSGDTVKVVNTGKAEYGLADMGTMIIALSRGAHTKMVDMYHHQNMFAIYVLKGSGVRTPKDLEGKTIGTVLNEGSHAVFPILAQKNGVDPNKVKFTVVTFSVKVPSLLAAKVDGVTSYTSDFPTYAQAAQNIGKDVAAIRYRDFGVNMYSNGVLVTNRRIREHPDQVRRFVQGVNRGFAWAVEHPDEGTKMFVKYNGSINPALARKHWDIAVDHLLTPTTEKTGIGFMVRERVQETIDIVAKAWSIPRVPAPEEVYTNEFITEKIVPKRP